MTSWPIVGSPVIDLIGPQLLVAALDRFGSARLHGKLYLFGGNATQAIGPSGVATVQKLEGRCFNGVQDGRESAVDANGGCGQRGYEHSTGFALFYNEHPVNTSSLDRAIDACNRHYGVTNCGRSCGSNYTTVTVGATCTCSSPEYRWHFGSNNPYGGAAAPGQVVAGGSCTHTVVANWY